MRENSAAETGALGSLVSRLSAAKSILAITHARPDGDTLGSAAALVRGARRTGHAAQILVPDEIPPRYRFLFDALTPLGPADFPAASAAADLILVVDTSVFTQLDGLDEPLKALRPKMAVVDHHATPGDIADLQWVDASASATGVLTTELLEELGWPIDFAMAEALLTAIVSDTGWFHFSNTDARTLRAGGKMLDRGVRADELYDRLFQSDRIERLKLLSRMLDSLELHEDNRLAVMTLRRADFEATGARPDETENLINEALRAGCVETVILLTEFNGLLRVSLRSRKVIDVAQLAKRFGGGGHSRAAGFRTAEGIDAVKPRLIAAFREELGRGR